MKTTEMTTRDGRTRRLRDSLHYVWQDTHRASRAMMRHTPYDDYLFNRRAND